MKAVIALVVAAVAILAYAATTQNLAVLHIAEDAFYNYDFVSKNAAGDNVDWPVTMVFYGNADVNRVKNIYWGITLLANPMYAYLNDGAGWMWDEDRGTKARWYSIYLDKDV